MNSPPHTIIEDNMMYKLSMRTIELLKKDLFYGSLPDWQKAPIETLINICLEQGMGGKHIAYVLATAYHESDRFKTKEEYRKGHGRKYGTRLPVWNHVSTSYHGRGWVQLTWLGNYAQFSARLSALSGEEVDLVNNPDLIINNDKINAYITVVGMKEGLFTGKKLSDYADYVAMRRVVNGTDKAAKIAEYAEKFEEALKYGQEEGSA